VTELRRGGHVRLEAPPDVQVLGSAAVISGRAAVDTYRVLAEGIRVVRTRDGITPPRSLQLALAALKVAAIAAQVGNGSDTADRTDVRDSGPAASLRTGEVIGLVDVARMLRLSERQARRRAGELGGWKRHPRAPWQFDRGLVATYINAAGGTIG